MATKHRDQAVNQENPKRLVIASNRLPVTLKQNGEGQGAEVGLVTPLADGMNLVCKEFCACNLEEQGVLILSEFAGAAPQLKNGALLVNPYDTEGVAHTLAQALSMGREERQRRMRRNRRSVAEYNIFWWVESFLRGAIARNLNAFPQLEAKGPSRLGKWRPVDPV